ncbi:MAG TPA: UDP-N-acetylmuramate dehydrogenase [Polyangiaceae bacterium]
MNVRERVPLAPLTSLRVGGAARRFVEAHDEETLVRAVREADVRGEPLFVLGGGSNVVVGDAGFDGLVVRVASRGVQVAREAGRARLEVAAGEPWDELVARAVGEGWSGIESLSGIPGLAGATPIQNVGAYGQEVRETVESVRVLDRRAGVVRDLDARDCRFAYRSSLFKGDDRFVVLRVTFALDARPESAPVRYTELAKALGIGAGERAPLAEVRRTVLTLRRRKGMVLDPADPDSVSAGSFFVNPILDAPALEALRQRLSARSIEPAALPCFPEEQGRTKVSAAWLIERAGFTKGWGEGRAGISRKHALALVNRGGATATELLAVAGAIQRGVAEAFGVALAPEPVLVGS